MAVKERLQKTLDRREMASIIHIQRGKDTSSDLFLGIIYGKRQRETKRGATTSKKLLVEEIWYSYIDWHRMEETESHEGLF